MIGEETGRKVTQVEAATGCVHLATKLGIENLEKESG